MIHQRQSLAVVSALHSLALYLHPASLEHIDALRHQAGPPRLVRCTDSSPIVSMEVFIKQQQVPPVRVLLKFFHPAEYRPTTVRSAQKEKSEPARQLIGDLS